MVNPIDPGECSSFDVVYLLLDFVSANDLASDVFPRAIVLAEVSRYTGQFVTRVF